MKKNGINLKSEEICYIKMESFVRQLKYEIKENINNKKEINNVIPECPI